MSSSSEQLADDLLARFREDTRWDWLEVAEWVEERVRAEERHRIAWWLRAGADGPFGESHSAEGAAAAARSMRSIADVIEQHPERFAEAPATGIRRRG